MVEWSPLDARDDGHRAAPDAEGMRIVQNDARMDVKGVYGAVGRGGADKTEMSHVVLGRRVFGHAGSAGRLRSVRGRGSAGHFGHNPEGCEPVRAGQAPRPGDCQLTGVGRCL